MPAHVRPYDNASARKDVPGDLGVGGRIAVVAFLAALVWAGPLYAEPDGEVGAARDDTGYTLLLQRLGAQAPDGADVRVAQIESMFGDPAGYAPNQDDPHFIDPEDPKTFNLMSGASTDSLHATIVGRSFYGVYSSLGPKVALIDVYQMGHWISNTLGRFTNDPPGVMEAKVANHSWARTLDDLGDQKVLRRADFLVERDGLVAVAAVDNGDTDMPTQMPSGYNSIAVGVTSLDHSAGPTLHDVPGRAKPDLVAPDSTTSYAAGLVSGWAASLVGEARERLWANGERPEVVKSILMAGAQKLPGWVRPWDDPDVPAYQLPLDLKQGAGTLRADRSWQILDAGEQDPSTEPTDYKPAAGWDYDSVAPGQDRAYYLNLPGPAAELNVNLTWLRRHEGEPDAGWSGVPAVTLDDLDLSFTTADGTPVAGGTSASPIDNVEHLRIRDLVTPDPVGQYLYKIAVSLTADDPDSPEGEFYGLAWQARFLGDVNEDGHVASDDLAAFRDVLSHGMTGPGFDADTANWTRNLDPNDDPILEVEDGLGIAEYLGAGAAGDTDFDGDVDATDLASLGMAWDPSGVSRTWLDGDFDFDGDVDATDLASLGMNWAPSGVAYTAPAGSSGSGDGTVALLQPVYLEDYEGGADNLYSGVEGGLAPAPEPATLLLLAGGMAGLLVRRRVAR